MHKKDLSVIVVDDLQFSREVVKSGLIKSGFTDIRTASGGEQALIMLSQRRAHVVLADFWMPGMTGLELTDLIRRWDEKNDRYTGIVLITAEDTPSSIVVAFDRGVDDFISKSASQSELCARVFGTARTAYQQNNIRAQVRDLSERFIRLNQGNLQDPETRLPNRADLEWQIQLMLKQNASRGGGLAFALIEINPDNSNLSTGTLKTITSSLKLALRPMDILSRFNDNTFAVLVRYQDFDTFDTDIFQRLVQRVKRHTHETNEHGKHLQISVGLWYGREPTLSTSVDDIISSASRDLHLV